MDDFLTPAQAAKILKVTAHEIRRLIRTGRLPAKPFGRGWMLDRKTVEKFERWERGRPKVLSE